MDSFELIKKANSYESHGDLSKAIKCLEDALDSEHSRELILELGNLYLKNKQEYYAYTLVKEEQDLFSDEEIFNLYCRTLKANHFVIEALELAHLSKDKFRLSIEPIAEDKQTSLMGGFRKLTKVKQSDYQKLFKLSLQNFKTFSQSLLLDPSQNFAVRLSLCEDLIKLGVEDSISVWIIGNHEKFIPAETELLKRNTSYREVISAIGAKYYHKPSQLPLALGETNLLLGSLYPKLNKYVDDPDSFASDLTSFIENHNGRGHQDLFERIYANLH